MSTGQLIVIAIATSAAACLQMVVGFGFALLAMPLMTFVVPVERAVVIVFLLSVVSTWWQAIAMRRDVDRALAVRLTAASLVGMPLGLVVLDVVGDTALRVALGVSVLIATALLVRRVSLAHVGPGLDYAAGFVSGVLNTSLATNGPPLVLDLQARHVPPDRFRATIAVVFAAGNVVGMALFVASDRVGADELGAAFAAAPGWAVGLAAGVALRRRVSAERFRVLVLTLLVAVAVSAIVAAIAG